ncbi:MAG: TRC40/GET3/ArsA family transport-energizing ATPase [Chloroflexota bacterium]
MRFILYLGKGGVGKTTTAAATALRSAQLGYKTLVASTDIAHSLADSLDMELDARPVQVTENLWAQEISAVADIHNYWDQLQEFSSNVIAGRGISKVVADELSAFPGMDEIVCLLHINKQAKEQNFDRIIIDAAPTGETIRLLTMPDTFSWYASHLSRFEKGAIRAIKPFAGKILQGPAQILDAIYALQKGTEELREILSDPSKSSYRVVLTPEKMVMREAERALGYLGLFNYPVDLAVVNRVMAKDQTQGEFYQTKYQTQQKYLELINSTFAPLPIKYAPYYAEEVVGLDALSQMAKDTFGDDDPSEIFYSGKVQEIIEQEDGSYLLRIPIPFVESGNVKLRKRGDELFVTIGNFKREMILPAVLAKRKTGGGSLSDGILEITFLSREEPVAEKAA